MTIQGDLRELLLVFTQHQNEWDMASERHPQQAELYWRRGTECFRARQQIRRLLDLLGDDATLPDAEIGS